MTNNLFIQTITRHRDKAGQTIALDLNGVPVPGMGIDRVTIIIDPTGQYDLYSVQCRIANVPVELDYVILEDVYESDSVQEGDKNE